jgi:hypothetical protein
VTALVTLVFSRAASCASVPLRTTVPVPLPPTTDAPLVPALTFRTPLPTPRVIVRVVVPASTSASAKAPLRLYGTCSTVLKPSK